MNKSNLNTFTRRDFLSKTTALSAASLLGYPEISHAEPPPETKKIRLFHAPFACFAPQYLAEELLRLEGFSEVEYVPGDFSVAQPGPAAVAKGNVDLVVWDAAQCVRFLDTDQRLTVLAGLHAGCWELFGSNRVDSLRDLKGKTIGGWGGDYTIISSILPYVGIDSRKDVKWLTTKTFDDPMRLFLEGKTDAFISFAPQPQEMRAKGIKAKVIVDTAEDKPWSQYFCCMISTNREFMNRNPIATKRALRAMLKAADLCAQEPERAARLLETKGNQTRYELTLEVLKKLPYRRWREAGPEDTLRFHALRLHEVGLIKSTPNKLIAAGSDWRFLNQIKMELKA